MNFLAPLFLLGGLALAAPIIYHLVRRTTRERTRFSSLMFLLPSPPRISKRHKLEHWLLLLLRCLALALLVLGFSRPFIKQAPIDDPTVAQPKRTVILVDRSASLRRAGAWDEARARAEAVLKRAAPADQVAVYLFDGQATPLVGFDEWNRTAPADRVVFASARLATVSPGWGGTQLGAALVTAAEALAEGDGKAAPGPRQIVLVSDLQAGSRLESLQAYEWPKGVDLLLEPVKAANPTNAGVQLVADAADSNRAVAAPVRIRVTNAADSKREQFKLGWARAGAAAGEFAASPLDAYVPPGQSRVFAVPVPADQPGLDRIILQGDDEAFDNIAYVIPPAQQKPTVLWIGRDVAEDAKQPLFFLRRAYAETPRVAVRIVAVAPAAALPPADVAAASLIFVTDALPAPGVAALRERALAGGTVVVVPSSAAAAPTLAGLFGLPGVAVAEVRPANYAMLSEIDFTHPLFAPFSDPRFNDFTKIHVWRHRRVDTAALPGARILSKFDSGDPAVIEAPLGRGRVFVLATGWQPEDSQLAVSSKFVPLLWSLLELGGGVTTAVTQHTVGERAALPQGVAVAAVRTPAGATVALGEKPGEFAATMEPGIYEGLDAAGARTVRFAVNLDANESRTAPLGADELEQLGVPVAQPAAAAVVSPENKTLVQGAEAENRQKLWRWFIAATLLILLVESALAGWTLRRAAATPQPAAS